MRVRGGVGVGLLQNLTGSLPLSTVWQKQAYSDLLIQVIFIKGEFHNDAAAVQLLPLGTVTHILSTAAFVACLPSISPLLFLTCSLSAHHL